MHVSVSQIRSLENVAGRIEGMKEKDCGKCVALAAAGKKKTGNTLSHIGYEILTAAVMYLLRYNTV
jgi:hypothetical protein